MNFPQNIGLCLVMMEGLTAFVLPSRNVSPSNHASMPISVAVGKELQLRGLNSNSKARKSSIQSRPVHMQQQDYASMVNNMNVWAEAPKFIKESKIVCPPSSADASGLPSFNLFVKGCALPFLMFSFSVLTTFFSEFRAVSGVEKQKVILSNSKSLSRICTFLNTVVPDANVSILVGAPEPCITFRSVDKGSPEEKVSKISDQEV